MKAYAYRSTITCLFIRRTSSFIPRIYLGLHSLKSPTDPDLNSGGTSRLNFRPLSMASNSCSEHISQLLSTSIIGGDHAGLSATFSPKSGELIPVPDHLIPETMLEWGDIPSHLETLVSENETADGIHRTTITVLPEVGCGIDNLETTKKDQELNTDDTQWQVYGVGTQKRIVTIDRVKSENELDVETVFETLDEEVTDENGDRKKYPRRIRISFSVDLKRSVLSSNISLQIERQLSNEATHGTRWTGEAYNSGGLDARTVTNHIGKDIVYGDMFAVKKKKQNIDVWDVAGDGQLNGIWTQTMLRPETNTSEQRKVHRNLTDFGISPDESSDVTTTIRLPQNILIRYGHTFETPDQINPNHWGIEISSIEGCDGYLQRKTVLRLFDVENDRHGGKSTSYYSIEEK